MVFLAEETVTHLRVYSNITVLPIETGRGGGEHWQPCQPPLARRWGQLESSLSSLASFATQLQYDNMNMIVRSAG